MTAEELSIFLEEVEGELGKTRGKQDDWWLATEACPKLVDALREIMRERPDVYSEAV